MVQFIIIFKPSFLLFRLSATRGRVHMNMSMAWSTARRVCDFAVRTTVYIYIVYCERNDALYVNALRIMWLLCGSGFLYVFIISDIYYCDVSSSWWSSSARKPREYRAISVEPARHSCSKVVTCGENFDFIAVTFPTLRDDGPRPLLKVQGRTSLV